VTALARIAGLLIATSVAAQPFAGGAVLVCKYTGRVIDPCACPRIQDQTPEHPALRVQGCCELRTSDASPSPAVVRAAPPLDPPPAWSPPQPWPSLAAPVLRIHVSARAQAPPSSPLYLSIRTLLI